MIPEKMKEILQHEGVVAIATQGPEGPHLVNTWNSYLQITPTGTMLVPVGGMNTTEANLRRDPRVLVTLGSREVAGQRGPGAGFLIRGTATIHASGEAFDLVKPRYVWARGVLEITITSITQTI
jgi:hypothetical protein